MSVATKTEADFWATTERDGPCLMWQGCRDRFGYGRTWWQGRMWRAHRLAWSLARGPIPAGVFVCHTCDRKGCVEPLHLFLGTSPDNTRDHVAKGRAHLNGRRESAHWRATLTPDAVREIRALWDEGVPATEIARRFGIAKAHAWRVGARHRWTEVPD